MKIKLKFVSKILLCLLLLTSALITNSYGLLDSTILGQGKKVSASSSVTFSTTYRGVELTITINSSGLITSTGSGKASYSKLKSGSSTATVNFTGQITLSPSDYRLSDLLSTSSIVVDGHFNDSDYSGHYFTIPFTRYVAPPPPPPPPPSTPPMACPSGTTKKGSGASAYCEKLVQVKENVNINLGDITNNLTGKDFGGSNDHNSSLVINKGDGNSNMTVNGMDGKDSNFINFTNIPVDGKVSSLTNTWAPEFIVTYKGKTLKAPKPTDATQLQQFNTALSEFTSQSGVDTNSHSQVEVIAYKVNAIEELNAITKTKELLISIFEKDSSGNYLSKDKIKFATVNKQGFNNYDEMKINQEGLYILATKYIDQTKKGTLPDKTTYTFKPVEISFLNTLGYLPISNYVVGQVNDMYMSVGLKKKDHGLSNLKYSNNTTNYKSMKVPSSHNYENNHSFVGSTNGGFSLVDPSLNTVPITSTTFDMADIKVSDVVENDGGFFISSDKGVSYLDVETKTVSATSIVSGVLDLEVINGVMYALSENKLKVFFIVGKVLLPSVKEYDLTGLFSSNKKPGKFEVMGDIISVSTIDEGDESEVIFLTTK